LGCVSAVAEIEQRCKPYRYRTFESRHYTAGLKNAETGRTKLVLVLGTAATFLASCAADKMRSYIG
jgi:hypothetical protein